MSHKHIIIDETRCKGCGLCTIACAHELVSLSDTPNSQGFTVAVFSDSGKCSGCALCAEMCPDVAIVVFKQKQISEPHPQESCSTFSPQSAADYISAESGGKI